MAEKSEDYFERLWAEAVREKHEMVAARDHAQEQYLDLCREIATAGVEMADPRLRYVALQIDRATWEACCAEVAHEAVHGDAPQPEGRER